MTSADTMSVPDTDRAITGSSFLVRAHAGVSLVFLVVGLALLLVATSQLAWPDAVGSLGLAEYLSYGRTMPAAINTLVFGWLTLGLLAVVHHAVPRLVGGPVALPVVALGGGALVAGGTGLGVGAILIGEGVGGRLLEMPWYADAVLTLGFLVVAVTVSATVRRSGTPSVPVAAWYLVAGPWWLFLAYAAGAIPGFTGTPAEIQSAFTSTAVYGLWLAPAAIGGGYYLIARLVPEASFHPRLGRIGFWSLGFTWAWTTARTLQYGPTPDWMETIPVLFTAGLVVAALTIAADFAHALRGRWEAVAESVPLRLYVAGTAAFLLVPGHMLLQSLRSSSAVVRFTAWESAFEYLTVVGAFTMWTAALLMHLAGSFSFGGWGRRVGRLAVASVVIGVLFAVGTRWVAGLQQGYTWLGGVESGTHANFGDGFRNTVAVLQGTEASTFIGLAVAAAGLGVFAFGIVVGIIRLDESAQRIGLIVLIAAVLVVILATVAPIGGLVYVAIAGVVGFALALIVFVGARASTASSPAETDPLLSFAWPDAERPSVIRRGAAAVFVIAALGTFLLPANESNEPPTLLADSSRDFEEGSPGELGRDLYIAEGCWYCHTQQVRAIVTDVGLGPVSQPGDYAYSPPGILGVARIGPDLMHAADRENTDSVGWISEHLRDPRAERPWSNMPAYDHLTDGELAALAFYVAGLE